MNLVSIFFDILFLFLPLISGIGSAFLFAPRVYTRCGMLPKYQPPPFVFRIVWPILYILFGMALLALWRSDGGKISQNMILMLILLSLLVSWYIIFANVCQPAISFVAIAVILGFTVAMTLILNLNSTTYVASLYLVPLMIWLYFATYLCFNTIPI